MTHHKDAELLPCPFCGSEAHFEMDDDRWEWVECGSCGMQGNRSASLMEDCKPKLSEAWNRRAPAAHVQQIDPVHGDCLPPIGSRVFIRHGRDDDAHPCIVTGYYAWGDLKGSKRLHRVFVKMVYEGTDTKQARMLCDCYATAEDALAAAPQPPEATVKQQLTVEVEPVQMPEPVAYLHPEKTCATTDEWYASKIWFPLYTEHQVREILKAHCINVKKSEGE